MTLPALIAMLRAAVDEDGRRATLERIIAAPVASISDIRAKVEALAWCRGDAPPAETTDERIISSLVRDLAPASAQGS